MGVLLREAIGDRLRRTRAAQHRTLREVSRAARISLGYLSEVERGQKEASSELLAAICDALDLPLADLLNGVAGDMRPDIAPGPPFARDFRREWERELDQELDGGIDGGRLVRMPSGASPQRVGASSAPMAALAEHTEHGDQTATAIAVVPTTPIGSLAPITVVLGSPRGGDGTSARSAVVAA